MKKVGPESIRNCCPVGSCEEKRNKRKHQRYDKQVFYVFIPSWENIALESEIINPNDNRIPNYKQTLG